ncbi:EAL domain-containing protein [Sedimenticola selenatireducens]|uniref:EAL domain-containing protein n=1 Tax=Sedimenticola selenatireducens TaxID=191960 RepID=A0A557RZG0_9GAMM|nr:EAL domain-containing protein [Sedimenticola selenatireducens]TVO70556.1 EAL domain-containing protein [Sedimenticola selenatireducens]TVT63133.1 MAG: EAL domain-containing protein [Sedimenticola selenatireducens]
MPGSIKKSFKGLPLLHFILLLSVGYLAVSLIFILILSTNIKQKAIADLSREDARQTSELIFQSLYSVMSDGWNKKEIMETISRLNKAVPNMEIMAYRGEPVIREFGDIPGEAEIRDSDPLLQKALNRGEEILQTNDSDIRFIYPVKVTEVCQRCHEEAKVGDINGVIDIRYPIENLKISLSLIVNVMLGYFIFIMALIFAGLFFKLRIFVVKPIKGLAEVMGEITHNADLSKRVSHGGWIQEVHHLTDYFNRMLGTLQDFQYRLEELSVRDPLTHLYNRRKFELFLDYEVDRASRHDRQFCLIMIDLDNFKHINDTYGHPIGDMALQKLAHLLQQQTRKTDVLARLGGDEFAMLLPETEFERGLAFAEKLRHALANSALELPDCKIRISASFGVVSYPQNGDEVENLNIAMDVAMYKAKRNGKNCVAVLGEGEKGAEMEVFRKGEQLRLALEEERIVAFVQPIVAIPGGLYAYEVLARIEENGCYLTANNFIHAAEELGLTIELDTAVFKKGLDYLASHSTETTKLFFNLASRTLASEQTIRDMVALARERKIPLNKIVFEITEREALPRISELSQLIDELHEYGIGFALDDFGSGFSSFLYLKYLSVDYVKIEGSFIRQIAVDRRDRIMVEHIASIANQFGMKTIAEMVEDEETNLLLQTYGINYAQGYYYGHPQPSTKNQSKHPVHPLESID